jgi:hypothetical protein
MGMMAGGVAVAAVFAARAYAQNACSVPSRVVPANGSSQTFQVLCQHESAGRGQSNATFVAQTQNNVKTLSASMSCCTGTGAQVNGLDQNSNLISGCTATASPGHPVSITCNQAFRWSASMSFLQ